jgi:branched-chain amino acid transport system ATP-binding protein
MLTVERATAGYGSIQVLHGVDLTVERGSVTCVVGPNGAGKTTLARTISSTIRCRSGRITFDGADITRARPEKIVRLGLVQVFEGRELFPDLTVRENLEMGAFAKHRSLGRAGRAEALEFVYDLFPRLADRLTQHAGTLSGGEQQMLAIGRALMSRPTLLLLDEPSLGLAPIVIQAISQVLRRLSEAGLTILLIDEDPQRALKLSDHGYVMVSGEMSRHGPAAELRDAAELEIAYLGRSSIPTP